MVTFFCFFYLKKKATSLNKNESVKTPIKKNMETDITMFNKNKWKNYICNNSPQLVLNPLHPTKPKNLQCLLYLWNCSISTNEHSKC